MIGWSVGSGTILMELTQSSVRRGAMSTTAWFAVRAIVEAVRTVEPSSGVEAASAGAGEEIVPPPRLGGVAGGVWFATHEEVARYCKAQAS